MSTCFVDVAQAGSLGARQLRNVLGADGRGRGGEPAGGRPGAQRHGAGRQVRHRVPRRVKRVAAVAVAKHVEGRIVLVGGDWKML